MGSKFQSASQTGLKAQFVSTFLTTVFLFCFSASVAHAVPTDVRNYDLIQGGFSNIEDGAFVEGSVKMGGIQPDYFIDLSQQPLSAVMKLAERIGRSKRKFWDKVGLIVELVRFDVFKYNNYYNPYYRRLLKQYRESTTDIPLHEYVACGAGVCREHALVLHFALKAAGIENHHVYANIYRASNWHNFEVREDHAFTVVSHEGTKWVVDAYYWGFNGFRLTDLMSAQGVTQDSPHAPIADPAPGTRRIIEINKFPIIFNPKNISAKCSAIFN